MKSVTTKDLNGVVSRINILLERDTLPCVVREEGTLWRKGSFVLEENNGNFTLAQVIHTNGATNVILSCGSKRSLYNEMQAFIQGVNTGFVLGVNVEQETKAKLSKLL